MKRTVLFALSLIISGCATGQEKIDVWGTRSASELDAHYSQDAWASQEVWGPGNEAAWFVPKGRGFGRVYFSYSSGLPTRLAEDLCEGHPLVGSPQAVRVKNTRTQEEHTFICEDVLNQQASQ